MNEQLAKMMLENLPSYMCVDGAEKEALARKMEMEHDGALIWRRVVAWIAE
jgi:hypothetical protein